MEKQKQLETSVSKYIRENCSFCIIKVEDKKERLYLESAIIGTLHSEVTFKSSENWLGRFSPEKRIADSGLWLVQGLNSKSLSLLDIEKLFNNKSKLL